MPWVRLLTTAGFSLSSHNAKQAFLTFTLMGTESESLELSLAWLRLRVGGIQHSKIIINMR